MKLFSTLIYKAQMNARSEIARIWPLFYRCQEWRAARAILTMRSVHASISALTAKIGKPVCYNVRVGGNSAAALFAIARIT